MVAMLVMAAAGLAFSGYLSAVNIFNKACAFGETCPLFLGYPACWFGFGMYLVLFVAAAIGMVARNDSVRRGAVKTIFAVSVAGILFAGRFAVQELLGPGITGRLGLSTCAYGLIMYVALCATSLAALLRRR